MLIEINNPIWEGIIKYAMDYQHALTVYNEYIVKDKPTSNPDTLETSEYYKNSVFEAKTKLADYIVKKIVNADNYDVITHDNSCEFYLSSSDKEYLCVCLRHINEIRNEIKLLSLSSPDYIKQERTKNIYNEMIAEKIEDVIGMNEINIY